MPRKRQRGGVIERYVISAEELEDVQVGGSAACIVHTKNKEDLHTNDCTTPKNVNYENYICKLFNVENDYQAEVDNHTYLVQLINYALSDVNRAVEDTETKENNKNSFQNIIPHQLFSCGIKNTYVDCNEQPQLYQVIYGYNGSVIDETTEYEPDKRADYIKLLLRVVNFIEYLVKYDKDYNDFQLSLDKNKMNIRMTGYGNVVYGRNNYNAIKSISKIILKMLNDSQKYTQFISKFENIIGSNEANTISRFFDVYNELYKATDDMSDNQNNQVLTTSPPAPVNPFKGAEAEVRGVSDHGKHNYEINNPVTGGRRGGLKPAPKTRRSRRAPQ